MDRVGLETGDRVALLVPGSAAYVDLVLALLRHGVFPIPMDPALTPTERDRLLEDLEPRRVIEEPDEVDLLLAAVRATEAAGVPGAAPTPPLGRPIHVTSGTTGRPKGVWSGLLGRGAAQALLDDDREQWGFSGGDVNLVLSPLHHSAPLRFATGTRLAGGRVVVPGPFDPARVSAAIADERPTTMFCVPAHLQRLFAHWDEVGVPDLSCFRLVAHAGAPCPDDLKRRLVATFPPRSTWEFYGSTEGQFTACRSEEQAAHPGTVGRARPGRSLTADPDGTLWCTVPDFARFSYLHAPEKTAAAWRDGPGGTAFTVGDHGRIDADGYVYLDGRREDLIISGGVNVYPAEVENVLGQAPGVAEVAVFGVDDERWGQRVCAAWVADDGAGAGAGAGVRVGVRVDEAVLADWARSRLAPAKRPKQWHRLDVLPRTSTGKVRRLDLPGLVATD